MTENVIEAPNVEIPMTALENESHQERILSLSPWDEPYGLLFGYPVSDWYGLLKLSKVRTSGALGIVYCDRQDVDFDRRQSRASSK